MKNSSSFITSLKNEAIGVGLILLVWVVSSWFFPAYVIPSPRDVLTHAVISPTPDLSRHLGITLYRVLVGFGISLLAGTALGMLAYLKKWGGQINALMGTLQVLPGMVLGVIFVLVSGIGSAVPILLILFMTLPTLTINTYNGLFNKNQQLEEYLMTIKSNKLTLFYSVYLPALIPVLQSNLSLGIGLSTKVVIMGEFIGSQDGLGYLLNNARIFLDMKEVFFYLLILLLFTLFFQAAQALIFSLFFHKYFYVG